MSDNDQKSESRASFRQGGFKQPSVTLNRFGHTRLVGEDDEPEEVIDEGQMLARIDPGTGRRGVETSILESADSVARLMRAMGRDVPLLEEDMEISPDVIEDFHDDIFAEDTVEVDILEEPEASEEHQARFDAVFNSLPLREIAESAPRLRLTASARPSAAKTSAPEHVQCTATGCGALLLAKAKFCTECGKMQQSKHCSGCGFAFSSQERFCPECGSRR